MEPRRGALQGALVALVVLDSCMGLPVPNAEVARAACTSPKAFGGLSGGFAPGEAGVRAVHYPAAMLKEEGHLTEGPSEGLRLRGGSSATKVKAANPQVKALKQAAVWTAKGITAAFTGLLTTSSVMVAFEFTAHKLHPAAVAAAQVPDTMAAMVLVGSIMGSVLGSLILSKLAPSHPTVVAFLVSALFTAAQYLNIQAVDHPKWFNIAGMCAFVPPYVGTALLTRGGAAKLWKMLTSSGGSSKAATKERSKTPVKAVETGSKSPRNTKKDDDEAPPASTVKKNLKTPAKPKSKKK